MQISAGSKDRLDLGKRLEFKRTRNPAWIIADNRLIKTLMDLNLGSRFSKMMNSNNKAN